MLRTMKRESEILDTSVPVELKMIKYKHIDGEI